MPEFERKNIRLRAGNYRGRRLHFITLCFHNRRRLGANARIARWIIVQIRKHADACGFFVHVYCVMPDHLHVLVAGRTETSDLIKFVESFKQETAIKFMRETRRPLWQFKYYDHILRAGDDADRVAWYIWMNPVRKGLCDTPTMYPFVGSFTPMGERLLKATAVADWVPPSKAQANCEHVGRKDQKQGMPR